MQERIGFNERNTDTQHNRRVNGQRLRGKLRTYKHIERNQRKQQQVRSNQKQMGTMK